jgi:FSR family fosmidomycin resistance protein-like MFS transporter
MSSRKSQKTSAVLWEVISISKTTKSLLAYTLSHFCVDFTCFFILFHGLFHSTDDLAVIATGFLLYNVIAFGLQPLIGFLCDGHPGIPIGLAGCILVLAGLFLLSFPVAALIVCAVGNACFHIGGGIDSLRFAAGRMTRSGIFVSTGALGVAFGTLIGKSSQSLEYIPYILISMSILLLFFYSQKANVQIPCEFDIASSLPFAVLLVLVLGSVVIRALAGGMIPMEWKTGTFFLLLPGLSACAGKVLGGILGDRFGAKTVGTGALLMSIPFLFLGRNIAFLSVIGIILFNITMPITLCAVASKFPYHPGFAFGLTTLALLCGTVPAYFYLMPQGAITPALVTLTVLSALFTVLSTKNKRGEKSYEKNKP